MHIRQDVALYATILDPGAVVTHKLPDGHDAWVQLMSGRVIVNGLKLAQGDGASLRGETAIKLVAEDPSEILVFDLG